MITAPMVMHESMQSTSRSVSSGLRILIGVGLLEQVFVVLVGWIGLRLAIGSSFEILRAKLFVADMVSRSVIA